MPIRFGERPKEDSLGTIGQILGAAAGVAATVATGGAAAPTLMGSLGALAGGAATGGGLGGLVGGIADAGKSTVQALQIGGNSEAAAMARAARQKAQDSLAILKSAEASLPQLPEGLRQEYGPTIIQARMLEERKRGIA